MCMYLVKRLIVIVFITLQNRRKCNKNNYDWLTGYHQALDNVHQRLLLVCIQWHIITLCKHPNNLLHISLTDACLSSEDSEDDGFIGVLRWDPFCPDRKCILHLVGIFLSHFKMKWPTGKTHYCAYMYVCAYSHFHIDIDTHTSIDISYAFLYVCMYEFMCACTW